MDIVQDNLILCSSDCSELVHASDPDFLTSFRHVLSELNTDLSNKTNYIEKLKMDNLLFAKEAESAERELLNENKLLKAKLLSTARDRLNDSTSPALISVATQTCYGVTSASDVACQTSNGPVDVEAEVSQMRSTMLALEANRSAYEGDLCRALDALSGLKVTNAEMLNTIETLSQDNTYLTKELEELQRLMPRSCDLDPVNLVDPSASCGRPAISLFHELAAGSRHLEGEFSSPEVPTADCLPRQHTDEVARVLVFGDGSSRGVAAGVRAVLDDFEYSVYGENHSGFSVLQMANRIAQLTTEFCSRDSVIVCLDLKSTGRLRAFHLKRLSLIGKFTNVIFSLTYSPSNAQEFLKYTKFYDFFADCKNVSVRILNNSVIRGERIVTRRRLHDNLALYVRSSGAMKHAFSLSTLIYIDTVDLTGLGVRSGPVADHALVGEPERVPVASQLTTDEDSFLD